ncbi:hypothetical protein EQV93_17170 [Pseudomonas sp. TMW22091]|nr:hypothetical protein [Pseudomonas sp. TMW22091]
MQQPSSKPRPALRLVGTKQLPREDWLAVRKQGIGSSDAAAAVGLNPYKSQLELWLEKTGRDISLPKIDPQDGDDDPLGSFVFRTTGFNSIRTLAARLHYLQAISGNRLACLPLELRLRGKSTRQSHGTPIFYVDITVRSGLSLEDALLEAKQLDKARQASGFDQSALDHAAQQGFNNGAFEDSEEDTGAVVEEFFPVLEDQPSPVEPQAQLAAPAKPSLAQKLESQTKRHNGKPTVQ